MIENAQQRIREISDQFRSNPIDPRKGIVELRRNFDAMGRSLTPPQDVSFIEVDADGVRAEWTRVPESEDSAVLLYLHGGGYIMGSPETSRDLVARICRAASMRALSVDYRLAPENPFPAAIKDAVKSYNWLLAQNVEPARIIIVGDSSGGGLTLATLLTLREAGIQLPAAICLSPLTDLAQTGESIKTRVVADPLIRSELTSFCSDNYLGSDGDRRNPLASPLYADLTGLPPLLIMVGSAETLLDDSTRFATKAKEAGVEVDLVVADEMTHVWLSFASIIPEGQEGVEIVGTFIRKHLIHR